MAPESRPPLTHQRPPLATRLRKSFESKRSKSETTSPSFNSYAVQDPEALQAAVDQAINSEAFLNAIAANLAKLIKPSITSALDTIQPIVEAVYSHDVLLRRTNKSVEDILERMDTVQDEVSNEKKTHSPPSPPSPHTPHSTRERSASAGSFHDLEFKAFVEKSNKRTIATLAELSNAVSGNNSKFASMENSMVETKESVEYLKAYLQNQLDQVQADMGRIVDTMEANRKGRDTKGRDDSLLLSHTAKLDEISAEVAGLKGYSTASKKLDSISVELNALRASFDASTSAHDGNLADLGSKMAHASTAIEAHGTALQDFKQSDKNSEIMAALQMSKASHESHASILNEMKERSLIQPNPIVESASRDNSESAAVLQVLKSDLASVKENIETGLNSNNDNVAGLRAKIESVLTTLEGHKATYRSTEILEAVQKSSDSHASHTSALDEIKSLVVLPASRSHNESLTNLESQIGSIIATLESHGTSLADLKAANISSPDLVRTEGTSEDVFTPTLESHTVLLNEIKDKDNISAEILTALHEIGQTQANHTATLSEIREADVSDEILTALHTSIEAHNSHESAFKQLHGAIQNSSDMHEKHGITLEAIKEKSLQPDATPVSDSIGLGDFETRLDDNTNKLLSEVKAVRDIVEKSSLSTEAVKQSVGSIATQIDINHTTITTSISTLGDELKAEVDASGTEVMDFLTKFDQEFTDMNIAVGGIYGKVEVLTGGVKLSETGLRQLRTLGPVVSVKEVGEHDSHIGETSGMDDAVAKPALIVIEDVKDPKLALSEASDPSNTTTEPDVLPSAIHPVSRAIPHDKELLVAESQPEPERKKLSLPAYEPTGSTENSSISKAEPALKKVDAQISESAEQHSLPLEQTENNGITTGSKSSDGNVATVLPKSKPRVEDAEDHHTEESIESPADSAIKEDKTIGISPAEKEVRAIIRPETTVEGAENLAPGPEQHEKITQSTPEPATIQDEEALRLSELESASVEELPANTKLGEESASSVEPPLHPSFPTISQNSKPERETLIGEEQTKEPAESKEEPDPNTNETVQAPSSIMANKVHINEPSTPLAGVTLEEVPQEQALESASTDIIDPKTQEVPPTRSKVLVPDVTSPALRPDEAHIPEPQPSIVTDKGLKSPPLPEATDEEESEPPSTLTSPVSPGFNDGEASSSKKGKKGKNGKNAKGGTKKGNGKKDKVPFLMDGEEPNES